MGNKLYSYSEEVTKHTTDFQPTIDKTGMLRETGRVMDVEDALKLRLYKGLVNVARTDGNTPFIDFTKCKLHVEELSVGLRRYTIYADGLGISE